MKGLLRALVFASAVGLGVFADVQPAAAAWDPVGYVRSRSATELGIAGAVAFVVILAIGAIVRDFRRPGRGGDPYRPLD
jgi:hypothetical protein